MGWSVSLGGGEEDDYAFIASPRERKERGDIRRDG